MERWVKLYESILEWEWNKDPAMMALWTRLLVMAQYRDREYQDMTIKRGQVVTSIRKLAEESGLSVRTVRTCLERLEATHQITRKPTHYSTLITICNYDKYQDKKSQSDTPNDTQSDKQTTHQISRKKEYIYNTTNVDNVRAREREAFERFFEGQIYAEQFCMNEGINLKTCKHIGEEVLALWEYTDEKHNNQLDIKNIKLHFISTLRIKIGIYKQKQKKNEEVSTDSNTRRRGADTTATRTEDYEDSF